MTQQKLVMELMDGNKIPTLKLALGNEVGYLTPFRGYRFQVSATVGGIGDNGGTQNFSMRLIADTLSGEAVLQDMASYAIMTWNARIEHSAIRFEYEDFKIIDKFVKESIEWLRQI